MRDFKIGGRVVETIKYADDLVVLGKEKTVRYMLDTLVEAGMNYEIEINVGKSKVMGCQDKPLRIIGGNQELKNVDQSKFITFLHYNAITLQSKFINTY